MKWCFKLNILFVYIIFDIWELHTTHESKTDHQGNEPQSKTAFSHQQQSDPTQRRANWEGQHASKCCEASGHFSQPKCGFRQHPRKEVRGKITKESSYKGVSRECSKPKWIEKGRGDCRSRSLKIKVVTKSWTSAAISKFRNIRR